MGLYCNLRLLCFIRYYDQLEAMEGKLPVSESQVNKVKFKYKLPLSPGQTRMRVAESSDFHSRLASNSHALSATLIKSRLLSLNLNMLKFFHPRLARALEVVC